MLHSLTPRNTSSTALSSFDRGDYVAATRELPEDEWRYWASLAAIGRTRGVADELVRFADPGAQLHAGIAAWMEGDDERAVALLRGATGEHASRLVALIERRPITVLAQLPWNRSGPWDLLGELCDPAFRLLNVSFHHDDIHNRPYANVHDLVPPGITPDFYVAAMLEWHLIPPNIRGLGVPVIGHTSDYDIHIQAVAPWLGLFDEVLVLDSVQWGEVAGIARDAHVSVFPKVFGVPRGLPDIDGRDRDIDVFVSGTVMHPYYPDKDAIVLQLLSSTDARLRIVNGFDTPQRYYRNLAESKICVNYIRHPGALPTRALEGLAMGCVTAVHDDNVLRLFLDRSTGLVTYGPQSGPLPDVVRGVLRDWKTFVRAAERGSAVVREEFDLRPVASQYLRFATVVAMRPRSPRRGPDPSSLVQKRAIVQKGWLPSYDFGGPLLTGWAEASVERLQDQRNGGTMARMLNDIARERVLASYHRTQTSEWLRGVIEPLDEAVSAFPRALVPRLNLARVLVHFGRGPLVRRAIELLDATLAQLPASWEIDPLDDVLPWDFCPTFFNYRRYFDTVTSLLAGLDASAADLTSTILASLHYYRGRYVNRVAGPHSEIEYAAQATELDPDFAEYMLYYCRLLIDRGLEKDFHEAAGLLRALSGRSARILEILDLARQLPAALQGDWHDELCAKATRFWLSTEMRKNLPEPWLQPVEQESPWLDLVNDGVLPACGLEAT